MVLIVAIIGMIIIMVRERNRVLVIETEAQTIHRVQHNGNIVQHHITILSTYGETALSWEEEDFANYHSLRLHIDSMMQAMHKGYEEFVSQSQIDSLRYLLSSKEEHLYQIMQLFHSQNSQEGMQFSHLPAEAQPRTVIRKKKGFTGFLGAKETLEIVPSASTILKTLNKELLSMQEERQESINAYTDSLQLFHRLPYLEEVGTQPFPVDEQVRDFLPFRVPVFRSFLFGEQFGAGAQEFPHVAEVGHLQQVVFFLPHVYEMLRGHCHFCLIQVHDILHYSL